MPPGTSTSTFLITSKMKKLRSYNPTRVTKNNTTAIDHIITTHYYIGQYILE